LPHFHIITDNTESKYYMIVHKQNLITKKKIRQQK
jgi:heat shock protein HspQ